MKCPNTFDIASKLDQGLASKTILEHINSNDAVHAVDEYGEEANED